ncbi:unnamed protein product [Hymenolepis diminuta]|uniref:Uncharacterized protein n=1 Tax=Hymenolepis diminuta TaxID=6216 RepID=A0A0R3SA17_HYMDI|nr:unnamed protein product [Hymenolepis diminuta]VUZ53486.1 unnamed protein product [Hymenolepis diminuta]
MLRKKRDQVEDQHKQLPLKPLPENGQGDSATTQTHHLRRFNKDYKQHHSLSTRIKTWWLSKFSNSRHRNKDTDAAPLTSTLAQQEPNILLNIGDNESEEFSSHFLAEIEAATVGSRLNLDKLVQDNKGILSADSLENLEFEKGERNSQRTTPEPLLNGDSNVQRNNTSEENKPTSMSDITAKK